MMMQMLVKHDAPLIGRQRAKGERLLVVKMAGTQLLRVADVADECLFFYLKVFILLDAEGRGSGRTLGKCIRPHHFRLHHVLHNKTQKRVGARVSVGVHHLVGNVAMRQHLPGIHFSPFWFLVGAQLLYPIYQLLRHGCFKDVFHKCEIRLFRQHFIIKDGNKLRRQQLPIFPADGNLFKRCLVAQKTMNTNITDHLPAAVITLFWYRRDLRFSDNAGLYRALSQQKNVLPIFIFDEVILDKLEDKTDKRVSFIYEAIEILKEELEGQGSSLMVFQGEPEKIFAEMISAKKIAAVYTNHDYEPYAKERDKAIEKLLQEKNIPFKTFKDQVIFERDEVVKDDGTPYTVYTPYSKNWLAKLNKFYYKPYPTEKYKNNLLALKTLPMVSLKDLGFQKNEIAPSAKPVIHRKIVETYEKTRNFPGTAGTTELSVHLRFGTVSIRKLVKIALDSNETWLKELIWREFFMTILDHFPRVVNQSFKPKYDGIRWRNNEEEFAKWCAGNTGYPMVDAGMRQLNESGFMHNRVRMVTASFLTKHLLTDWRWGEAYFAEKLNDYELSSNNGNWQWAAGCGCDAAPYFRIFNPESQQEKFDKDYSYVKKWVPEYGTKEYPEPMVEHKMARERALEEYKSGVKRGEE